MELMVSTPSPEQNCLVGIFFWSLFPEKKTLSIISKLIFFLLIYSRKVCLGKCGGLVSKGKQVIFLINGDPVHRCTYASPGLNELMQARSSIVQAWELCVCKVLTLLYPCVSPWSYLSSCPGYFRIPHWLSMGLPERLEIAWQVSIMYVCMNICYCNCKNECMYY